VGRWWERADRGFTEENSRNNLMVKLSASGRRPWVHSKYGVCMTQVAEGSPELDRLEKQRLYQNVGRAQRRGESWCAAPLDKSLQMPGSGIKKQQRFSAAPAQDPMKMELGDEVRSKDGWLWVVRSCGGKRTGRGQRRELVAFSRGFLLRLSFGGRCRGILSEAAYVYLSAQI